MAERRTCFYHGAKRSHARKVRSSSQPSDNRNRSQRIALIKKAKAPITSSRTNATGTPETKRTSKRLAASAKKKSAPPTDKPFFKYPAITPAPKHLETPQAIQVVDDILSSVGLSHGTRSSIKNTWKSGERKPVGKQKALAEELRRKPAPKLELDRSTLLSEQKGIVHAFSTRSGGTTRVYRPGLPRTQGDLNLGFTSHDDRSNVQENRNRLLQSVGGKSSDWKLVTLHQKHTAIVTVLTDETTVQLRGDAVISPLSHRLLAVMTADCIPVLVADPVNNVVAAFHAGWRGTLARIVERGIGTMRMLYNSDPAHLVAAIGPGINACCYAVSEDIQHNFRSQFAYADELFTSVFESDPIRDKYPLLFLTARAPGHSPIGPQLHLNLVEANRRQLLDAGLAEANIDTASATCTACNTSRYFSHRAEQGFTGRMMSVIGQK